MLIVKIQRPSRSVIMKVVTPWSFSRRTLAENVLIIGEPVDGVDEQISVSALIKQAVVEHVGIAEYGDPPELVAVLNGNFSSNGHWP